MILLCLQRVHRPVLRRYFSSGLRHCYLESPLKQAATPGLTFTCRTVKGILSMCLHFYAGPHLRQTYGEARGLLAVRNMCSANVSAGVSTSTRELSYLH